MIDEALPRDPLTEYKNFADEFSKELERVSTFFTDVLQSLESIMTNSLEKLNESGIIPGTETNDGIKKSIRKQKKDREVSAIREYTSWYKKMEQLESFATLNIILCIKILKKHDKLWKSSDRMYPDVMDSLVLQTNFGRVMSEDNPLNDLRVRVVKLYAEFCCDGDIREASGKLKMSKGDDDATKLWGLGLRIGGVMWLCCWFLWDVIVDVGDGQTLWNDPAIYLYSFLGNLLVYDWLWAGSVYVWEKSNVNYLVLLDLAANHAPGPRHLFGDVATKTMFYLINFILYYKARRRHLPVYFPPHYFPLALAVVALGTFTYNAFVQRNSVSHRLYSPQVISRIVTSPFSAVTLREQYTGDVMTSCIRVFTNGAYACCYIATEAYEDPTATLHQFGACSSSSVMIAITGLLSILPLWFRFAQCLHRIYESSSTTVRNGPCSFIVWPHSYNALKYMMGIVVVLMGIAHPLGESASSTYTMVYKGIFIAITLATTLYQFYWDVYMDWGLFRNRPRGNSIPSVSEWSKTHLFLRPKLLYKTRVWVYYVGMALDLILRAMWTLSLIPQGASGPFSYSLSDQLGPFLAMFELCRRSMWGLFKLEWEHVCAGSGNTSGEEHFVSFHLEKPKTALSDGNHDIKIAFYHISMASFVLGVVIMLILSFEFGS